MKEGDLVFVYTDRTTRIDNKKVFGVYVQTYNTNNTGMSYIALLEPLPNGKFDFISVREDRLHSAAWTFHGPVTVP